ncbi:MAG: Daunorubicin/doxorubicin resistance ATP-binding protein DrrA [Phycisphaerae bacterium]|nr:Daunorubicin/doxorubicin resistance ATP-binding protein DrrA [Phycisphaerae bacterium]
MPPVLTVSGLIKSYDGVRRAVDGVTFDVKPREIFGLLGPNGAGKSTTIHVAVGLLAPDGGEVRIGDPGGPSGPPTDPVVRSRVGVAPQALAIYEELTGEENIRFFAQLQGLRGGELRNRTAAALQFVELHDRRRDLARTYSGGMKRRLNLAAAIVHDPQLLFLDEPTVGVDPQSRNAIFENILALRERGLTVVYTTHYMEEAQRLCDRVAIMDQGRILALDTVDGLVRAHGGKSVVVAAVDGRESRIESDDPIGELMRLKQGGPLRDFRLEQPNLERVFLNLTGRQLRD